jgi:heme/copper-type cytochrome/quinol oxidase subunit 1
MHFLGMTGMPRRIPDYVLHFFVWNHLGSIGLYSSFTGIILFLYILKISLVSRFTNVQTPNLNINEG